MTPSTLQAYESLDEFNINNIYIEETEYALN